MPKNKTTRGKTKTKTKTKTSRTTQRSVAAQYSCPNPGRPFTLTAIVEKMQEDPAFALFIRKLLCRAHQGDEEASACLRSYYGPTKSELTALCFSESRIKAMSGPCTDITTNALIDIPAYVYSM
jgi:hypothetical protein